MALGHEYGLMVDTPIEFTDRGDAHVTVVGRHEKLRGALEAAPESVSVSVEQVGEYTHADRDVLSLLTARQREVFETAVERGYYEIPRLVNQRELAETLDLAPSTVDEHIRKAESRVLSAVLEPPEELER
jgi:predicted DNA binding protein